MDDEGNGEKGANDMISVAIMGTNEADNIGDCLASIHDWADEIIYVDTGSTDDTMKVVEEFKQNGWPLKIFEHQWQDSFSEARNYSFDQC